MTRCMICMTARSMGARCWFPERCFKPFASLEGDWMSGTGASGRGPPVTAEEAAELERGRERMLARHKLIVAMIRNNEQQLRNESARGGAEIEHACALRDCSLPDASGESRDELERVTARLRDLEEEHIRLVAEREWLNSSLREFDSGASAEGHHRAGHA